jgi:hypothetical protein
MTDFLEEIERFFASFSPEEVAVSRYAFQALLGSEPAKLAELPAALALPSAVVTGAVGRLVERGVVVVDETGRMVGVRGLSLPETDHRLTLAGRHYYAFCAVDAVGIPAALKADARVESRCHHCRMPLTLELKDGVIVGSPEGMVIWAVERDLTRSLRAYT